MVRETSSTAAERPAGRPEGESPSREERIRQRAYERYQSRGGADGSPQDDWLEAERQVDGESDPSTVSPR